MKTMLQGEFENVDFVENFAYAEKTEKQAWSVDLFLACAIATTVVTVAAKLIAVLF